MDKEALLKLVEETGLAPIIGNETTDTQVGWSKTSHERIPVLDALVEEPPLFITVERRQIASLYQYNLYCSAKWLD